MRRILTTLAYIIISAAACAQNGSLYVSVAVSQQQMTDNADILRLLKSKLASSMSTSGLGMTDYSSIVISPTTTITNRQTVEGGMRNIMVCEVDLSLSVSQVITDAGFNSVSISLRGEGYTEKAAMMSAISKLSATDSRLVGFFSETKTIILDYYRTNLKNIITKAKTLAGMQRYDEALVLLSAYPEYLPDYDDIAEEMNNVYSLYQRKHCNELLQKARNAYAVKDYREAVLLLDEIDMLSPCANEAKALANKIKSSVDADQKQTIAMRQQELKTEADIKKRRIQAIENITKTFFENMPQFYFVL